MTFVLYNKYDVLMLFLITLCFHRFCFNITGVMKISQIRDMAEEIITEKSLETSAFCAFPAFTCLSVSE